MTESKVTDEMVEAARAVKSAHEAFQEWKRIAPKDASAPRSLLEMNAGAKARLFAALAACTPTKSEGG